MDERETIELIAGGLDRWDALLGRQYGPLSRPQRRIMRLMARRPAVRVGDLAASLGHTAAGTTKMLDLIERLGYVQRVRLPDTDQRQVYVELTAAGNEALREADLAFIKQVKGSLTGLTAAERATLATLLASIGPTPRQATPGTTEEPRNAHAPRE